MLKSRIYIIGYMASGKSTFGKKLAKKLQYNFVDLDSIIELGEKRSISSIFETLGEHTFREIEQAYLHKTDLLQNTVISCGGGTPCFFDNMDWMNTNGETIYLKISFDILISRLQKARATRPLVANFDNENLRIFVQSQLNQRTIYYEKAKISFDAIQSNLENLIDKLMRNKK